MNKMYTILVYKKKNSNLALHITVKIKNNVSIIYYRFTQNVIFTLSEIKNHSPD